MKTGALLVFLFIACSASAQNLGAFNGHCQKGAQNVVTQGLVSSGTQPIGSSTTVSGVGVEGSYPSCSVSVYLTGTLTLASIYSNNAASPTPLANPFNANTDDSYLFFGAAQVGYDIQMCGAGLPACVTLTDEVLCNTNCGVAPTGAITVQTNGTNNTTQSLLNFLNANGCTWTNPSGGEEEVSCPATVLTTEVNGTPIISQTLLDFVNANSCTWTNPSGGIVEVACSGSGGGVTGSGTASTLPIWTGSTALGNSQLSQASGSGGTYLGINLAGLNLNNRNTGSGQFDLNCSSANNCGAVFIQAFNGSSTFPASNLTVDNVQGVVEITTSDSSGNGGAWFFEPGLNRQTEFPSTTFANLQSPPSVGWVVYCSNCSEGSNPCSTSGGTGSGAWAFSMEVNGGGSTKWKCF